MATKRNEILGILHQHPTMRTTIKARGWNICVIRTYVRKKFGQSDQRGLIVLGNLVVCSLEMIHLARFVAVVDLRAEHAVKQSLRYRSS